jgi:hypothetical protein
MPADTCPLRAVPPEGPTQPPPDDKLLIGIAELAVRTSLSVRTLRRLDASGDIPGRVVVGRRVLFQTEIIREWVRAGLPDHDRWAVIQKHRKR